jgi:glucokinase
MTTATVRAPTKMVAMTVSADTREVSPISSHMASIILAGDVGGTHTRLALFGEDRRVPLAFDSFRSHEHAGLEQAASLFLDVHPAAIDRACFGVAGPVRNGRVTATNLAWPVDAHSLSSSLGIPSVTIINDLAANAYGIAELAPEDLKTLNEGLPVPGGPRVVISAGTGLGEAGVIRDESGYVVIATEGGHTDFGPRSDVEVELYRQLATEGEHVSYERVCSGIGLLNIYRFFRRRSGMPEPSWLAAEIAGRDAAAAISAAALDQRDSVCIDSLDLMVSIYGAEAGNLALKYLATGGVYVGGGIAPRILSKLGDGTFMRTFTAKGRFKSVLEQIPVTVIVNESAALLGAAHYARSANVNVRSVAGPAAAVGPMESKVSR